MPGIGCLTDGRETHFPTARFSPKMEIIRSSPSFFQRVQAVTPQTPSAHLQRSRPISRTDLGRTGLRRAIDANAGRVLACAPTWRRRFVFVLLGLLPAAEGLPVRACAFEHTALPVHWTGPGLAAGLRGYSYTASIEGLTTTTTCAR